MKKLVSLCITTLLALNLFACTSFPSKKETVFSVYNKILVKPLSFDELYLNNFDSIELLTFYNSRPQFVKLFNDNFFKYAGKTGYFDEVLFEGIPDQSTVVLEPTLSIMDQGPASQRLLPGNGEIVCRLRDGVTNRLLGSYHVHRSAKRSTRSNLMGTVSALISGMGEDAASRIAEAK